MVVNSGLFSMLTKLYGLKEACIIRECLMTGAQVTYFIDDADKARIRHHWPIDKANEIIKYIENYMGRHIVTKSSRTTVVSEILPPFDAKIVYYSRTNQLFPSRVIKSGPAFIVLWNDGTKTIIKKQKGDRTDDEKAMALCWMKKLFGNTGHYYDMIKMGLNLVEERK